MNERNAGRKPKIKDDELVKIRERIRNGEKISSLAGEYGISRQALYKKLKEDPYAETRIDYYVDNELCSTIYLNGNDNKLRLVNYAVELSRRAFGYNEAPVLRDLQEFLERQYLLSKGIDDNGTFLLKDDSSDIDILGELCNRALKEHIVINEGASVPVFRFSKKERVLRRTDTDGYQMKAITADRRFFVKSQAIMGSAELRDWAVEIIASDICRQLGIPCVVQRQCRFVYGDREFDGVYSDNFELDGYSFISFERLLERDNMSSKDEDFIRLGAIDKLKWCAEELSRMGDIPYEDTLKYMTDLAVVDCIIGNTDRHTRNFGLFYDINRSCYRIPLLFDNGMGLFENDPYRDRYETFKAAMNNVYVSPYGEDPFDLIKMLDDEFDLKSIYHGIDKIEYKDILSTPFALEYERRIRNIWQK